MDYKKYIIMMLDKIESQESLRLIYMIVQEIFINE